MSYKQFRSDLATQFWNKYKERNLQFNQIESFPISDELKKQVKEAISKVLSKEMEETTKTPKYARAKKLHIAEVESKREYDRKLADYEGNKKIIFDEQMSKIDELNREMWKELSILRNLWLHGDVLHNAENQVIEKFEEKKNQINNTPEYAESFSSKLNLLRAKKDLILAWKKYESDEDENLDNEWAMNNESWDDSGERKKKKSKKKVDWPIESLQNIPYQSTDNIILPTNWDERTIKKWDWEQVESTEEEYVNKINLLFSKILNVDNWFNSGDYRVIVWKDSKDMIRKNSYIIVEIPNLNKTILVNNCYWEASFLCDKIFEDGELVKMSKSELMEQFWNSIKKTKFQDEEQWIKEITDWLNQTNDADLNHNKESEEIQEMPGILRKLSIIMDRNYAESSNNSTITLRELHKKIDDYFKLFFYDYSFWGNDDIVWYPHVDFNYLKTLDWQDEYDYKLEKLSALSDTMILENLINEKYYREVRSWIENYPFENLSKDVLEKLLKFCEEYYEDFGWNTYLERYFSRIVKNIKKFKSKEFIVHDLLDLILLDEKKYGKLMDILLNNINHYFIIELLLNLWKYYFLEKNIDKFSRIKEDDKKKLKKQIEKYGEGIWKLYAGMMFWYDPYQDPRSHPRYSYLYGTLFDPEEDDPADATEKNKNFWGYCPDDEIKDSDPEYDETNDSNWQDEEDWNDI